MNKNSELIILRSQLSNELTETCVYRSLAELEKDEKNKAILQRISDDEASHANIISSIIGEKGTPSKLKVSWIVFCARLFGITFTLKLMENGENAASKKYHQITDSYPTLKAIAEDEEKHEEALINMLNDERLNNMGAIVLGLNDALVELTGALAGFTFALGSPGKIAKLGLITGFAAAMSMAASAFLSARAENHTENNQSQRGALKTAAYTGIAYILTVIILVAPYMLMPNATIALITMLLCAFGVIAFFNFYLSVARGTSFIRGFSVMAGISTAVALISYAFGYFLK